jgi:drug/metabolite transporter (DMT)-like permease
LDKKPLLYVILSATLFGLSLPLAKLLVKDISPLAMAGLLYLGAFIGLAIYSLVRKTGAAEKK